MNQKTKSTSSVGEIHNQLRRLEQMAKEDGFHIIADRIATAVVEAERLLEIEVGGNCPANTGTERPVGKR